MSDSLTDAQRVMAEVHLAHTASGAEGIVTCWCCEQFPSFARHSEHVSVEIDKALGGLTREVSKATRYCSYPGSDGPCVGKHHGRFVGGWTPEGGPA